MGSWLRTRMSGFVVVNIFKLHFTVIFNDFLSKLSLLMQKKKTLKYLQNSTERWLLCCIWSYKDVCVCLLHLLFLLMKKGDHGPKSPGVIYSGQPAEWQTFFNQCTTMRGNLKTLTRIKLCFDFLISLISSEPRYCVIFLPWHDILFCAVTALCCRFGDRGKGSSSGVGGSMETAPSYLVGCSFWYRTPHQLYRSTHTHMFKHTTTTSSLNWWKCAWR